MRIKYLIFGISSLSLFMFINSANAQNLDCSKDFKKLPKVKILCELVLSIKTKVETNSTNITSNATKIGTNAAAISGLKGRTAQVGNGTWREVGFDNSHRFDGSSAPWCLTNEVIVRIDFDGKEWKLPGKKNNPFDYPIAGRVLCAPLR